MARSPLFAQLKRAMKLASSAEMRGWSEAQFSDEVSNADPDIDGRASRTRRDFLKASSVLAATPLMIKIPFLSSAPVLAQPAKTTMDPVLILGAGAAGLAAAYTLKKAGVPFKVLEASSRLGGRIYTQTNFNADGQFIERGAELVDSGHNVLIELARELGLEIEDFSLADRGLEKQLMNIGGVFYTQAQLAHAVRPLVKAVKLARSQGAQEVTYHDATTKPLAAKWDNMTLADYLHSLDGHVDAWALKGIGIAFLGEFGLELEEQSALNLLNLLGTDLSNGFKMFGESDESKRIKGGCSRLIDRLAEEVNKDGMTIETGSKVVAIHQRGRKLVVSIESNGAIRDEVAAQVISTIPFTVLREVAGLDTLGLRPVKLDAIRNLAYGTNSKIMLELTSKQWREKGHAAPASTGMLYSDVASQSFWDSSRLQPGANGILTNFIGGRAGFAANRDAIQARCLPDLEKIHAGLARRFVKGVVHNWNQIPTAKGSYSCLRAGDTLRFYGTGGETELDGRLLFAGEQASLDYSGYMNGAYETGISAAREILLAHGL
jgi:monoamine oxidase